MIQFIFEVSIVLLDVFVSASKEVETLPQEWLQPLFNLRKEIQVIHKAAPLLKGSDNVYLLTAHGAVLSRLLPLIEAFFVVNVHGTAGQLYQVHSLALIKIL